jgi:malate dehydrogenase
MRRLAILGSSDLAATLARRVAEHELAREIVMVDADVDRASGKALDIAQSGPVEGYDARVLGAAMLLGTFDAVVIADVAELRDATRAGTEGVALLQRLAPAIGDALVVVASVQAAALVRGAAGAGLRRERVLGSAPIAFAAALRRRIAADLDCEPGAVSLALLGALPDHALVPRGSVTVGGIPVDALSPVAVRRALGEMARRELGPVALAAAALRLLRALSGSSASVLPVIARLEGEYGHRGAAIAVPARVAAGRLQSVIEVALDPVDRIALDNAAEPRAGRSAW